MDVRDLTTSIVRAVDLKCGGIARLRGEVSPEARARPRQSSRGLGKDSGALRATRRTQPWAQPRCGGTRGRKTRRSGPTTAQICSDEQSREDQGNKRRNRSTGRLLTSRGNSGAPGKRRGRRDASGRWRWLWLHGENAGERGPSELERLGANREVSRIAVEGAEFTETTDTTGARRRPRNSDEPSTEFHGHVRRARERERGSSAKGATG
jgi:hypothetical protein